MTEANVPTCWDCGEGSMRAFCHRCAAKRKAKGWRKNDIRVELALTPGQTHAAVEWLRGQLPQVDRWSNEMATIALRKFLAAIEEGAAAREFDLPEAT